MKGPSSNLGSGFGHRCGVMVALIYEPVYGTVAEGVLRALA